MLEFLRGKGVHMSSLALRKIAVVLVAVLLVTVCGGFTYTTENTITIADAGKSPVKIITSDTNVAKILSKQGIVLNDGDELNVALTDHVHNNGVIKIYRANTIELTYMGETKTISTAKATVAEVLENLGILVDKDDKVEPALKTPVTDGLAVSVVIYDRHSVTVQEEIAYETQEIYNQYLGTDERKVVQKGYNGVVEYEYDILCENGQEISRSLTRETRLSNPVEEIVEYGPENVWELGVIPASRPKNYTRVERFRATAYDASPMDNGIWAGKTSTGMPLVYGVIAVDPRVIPYGTKMYIESVDGQYIYGYAIAGDCGGAIKGKKVDLFFPSRSTCYQFGRRDVNIYFMD